MKKFKVRKGNFLKSKNSTSNMMYNLLICLIPFIIFATYKNGIYPVIKGYGNLYLVFKPLIFVVIASFSCIMVEYLYYLIIRKERKTFNYLFSESFALIPGVFIGLIIPINTPIWLLILGSMIASLSKMLMGGLGKNKLNPALVGSLFITIIFSSFAGGYLNPLELDTISSATPLANMTASSYVLTYDNLVSPYGNLLDFFFGNIPGSIGETSSFLCIIAFIYLVVNKVIKWRIPISYIGTVIIMSLIMCLSKDIGLWFIGFNILSGGLLFGAVFMATDPVTTPISHEGQIIAGILLGLLTMAIRYLTPLPEGVLVSILIINITTLLINYFSVKLFSKRWIEVGIIIFLLLIVGGFSFVIGSKIHNKEIDDSYKIISKQKDNNTTTYQVSGRGYTGSNSIKLKIVFKEDDIIKIEVIESNETYMKMIFNNDYLEKIISNQDNLDDLNTISGCTYTSKYIKEIVDKTMKDYFE